MPSSIIRGLDDGLRALGRWGSPRVAFVVCGGGGGLRHVSLGFFFGGGFW